MIHGGNRAATLLFFGDIGVFTLSLLLTLLIRYGGRFDLFIFNQHIGPFTILFFIWGLVFYMSGLYGKRILLNKSSLADAIVKTQLFNVVLAALFFFLVPGIDIAPKTNLLIYLVVSMTLVFLWRIVLYPKFSLPRYREPALLIAHSKEASELVKEVNGNPRYHLSFLHTQDPKTIYPEELTTLASVVAEKNLRVVVIDMEDSSVENILASLYRLKVNGQSPLFLSFADVYENVFDRIPLSELKGHWFIEYASARTSILYAAIKRIIDIVGALVMGFVTIVAIPIIWTAQGFEGPGPLFIVQDRMGKQGARIKALKFRSMHKNDVGAWKGESENTVTKVGAFLRKTSLDEFPQFFNVLKGEMSLIGPRNDMVALGERLASALPHYHFRYAVTPGITGWAQINQQYEQGHISPQSIEETKVRLAYDFYYLKHRSLGLDLVIALKTIKRMFFRVSSW